MHRLATLQFGRCSLDYKPTFGGHILLILKCRKTAGNITKALVSKTHHKTIVYTLPLATANRSRRYATMLHLMIACMLTGMGIACVCLYWFTTVSPKFDSSGAVVPFLIFGILCILTGFAIWGLNIFGKSWLRRKQNNLLFRLLELLLLGGGAILFLLNGWQVPAALFGLMAAVMVYAIFQERGGEGQAMAYFTEKGIDLHTAGRKRLLLWTELESVILRHGILTINTVENKMWQLDVVPAGIDATAVQEYARQQIETHVPLRIPKPTF